jgi:hypothetical protein
VDEGEAAADAIRAVLGPPVGADVIGEFSLPATMTELAAAIEHLAVQVEDQVENGWEAWAVVAGLAALAGETARRQLRRKARPAHARGGRWVDPHGL